MSTATIDRNARVVKPPTETLQHLATEYVSFKTGSRVFGGAAFDSDWDVCGLNRDGVCGKLISEGFRESEGGSNEHPDSGCHNLIKGKVNVILLPEPLFTAWRLATDAMPHVGGCMRDKRIRISKFSLIRDGYLAASILGEL